jgi:hypothetical protein
MGPTMFSTLDKFPHYTKLITLILLAGTIEFVHIEQISVLFKFRFIQVSLYYYYCYYYSNIIVYSSATAIALHKIQTGTSEVNNHRFICSYEKGLFQREDLSLPDNS